MLLLRLILLPLTILYATGIFIRNLLYSSGILNRTSFDIPLICVGNLAAGGTGKTPHIEYLIRSLGQEQRIALLSRGYMRKTKGYVFAGPDTSAETIGDEPFQVHRKFPEVAVGVSANRVLGLPDLLADAPGTSLVLMDDGFQHLPIRAGFYILLTSRHDLFTRDWLLPSGRLREFRSAYQRADIIIVTKCAPGISAEEQAQIRAEINPLPGQFLCFSTIRYGGLKPVFNAAPPLAAPPALGFAGIADAGGFEAELKRMNPGSRFRKFADHHHYTEHDLRELVKQHGLMPAGTILVTTEKDAVKLKDHPQRELIESLPVYYLDMEVQLIGDAAGQFMQRVRSFIATPPQD